MNAPASRLRALGASVGAGVRRFPLALAAGLVGAIAGVVVIGRPHGDHALARTVLLTCWLGVSGFLALALAAERATAGRAARFGWPVAGPVVLAGAFSVLWRHHEDEWLFIRFALWLVVAHALIALAPLAGRRPRGDFRAFNLMLFSRTALALLLTHVLCAGLCFALMAVKQLFDVPVPNDVYPKVWFVLMGVFNTAYVLAGIPRDWDRLGDTPRSPVALDVLARLVLLPLSVLYLAILYVYSAKIIVVREWPRGWVSAPVIVFAAVGLLTVLLLGPERQAASRAVRAYCRGFFFALLPLVVLLFLAISRRALEYGLTEERGLVYAIALYLAIVGPYFVLSRARHLAVIPLALAAIALLASAGPLSVRTLSVRSQTARVRGLLERHHRLEGGVLVRAPEGAAAVPPKDEAEISGALRYLESRDELGRVRAWLSADKGCERCVRFTYADPSDSQLVEALGMTYRPWGYEVGGVRDVVPYETLEADLPTKGYDWHVTLAQCGTTEPCRRGWRASEAGADQRFSVALEGDALRVEHDGRRLGTIQLAPLTQQLAHLPADQRRRLAPRDMTLEGAWRPGGGGYLLRIHRLTVAPEEEAGPVVKGLEGELLVRD
jgi:hypothetical protein